MPSEQPSTVPLNLLRHGSALVSFGLLFGFVVPLTPYPRLGLTAHIQFAVEGVMVIVAGLVLQSDPFVHRRQHDGDIQKTSRKQHSQQPKALADRLSPVQRRIVYWGLVGIWITLLSEVANAWWGTQWVLPLAHEAAGLKGDGPASKWMEMIVNVAHKPLAVFLSTVVSGRHEFNFDVLTVSSGRPFFMLFFRAINFTAA